MNTINPRPEQLKASLANVPQGVPVVMLNLIKFREKARYPGAESNRSGREAYARYSQLALTHLRDVGGELVWFGEAQALIIAPPNEAWDQVFLIRYPSLEKFFEMVSSPAYQEIVVHRTAALRDSRLIATTETS